MTRIHGQEQRNDGDGNGNDHLVLPWKSLDCERHGEPREVRTTLHTKPFARVKATTPRVFDGHSW